MGDFYGVAHDVALGLVIAFLSLALTWLTSSVSLPIFHFTTGWFFRHLALLQIQYHVRRSSILPDEIETNSFWQKTLRFFQGAPLTRDTNVARESPLTKLMEPYLGGKMAYNFEDLEFTGLSSYVLYIRSDWGKTKACEYLMRKKIARGIMFRRLVGVSYETSIRSSIGWFCRLLSKEDFRFAFAEAIKNEAAALPATEIPQHVVILFDEWNGSGESDSLFTSEDKNFADFVMRKFSEDDVLPVFLTHNENLANQLCYLNRGRKIRPFPNCVDRQCEWERGDPNDEDSKYVVGKKIIWKHPHWMLKDLLRIGEGQEVWLPVPPKMCSLKTTKRVPMTLPSDPRELMGLTPKEATRKCRSITRTEALQKASGGRQQALLENPEMVV